MTLITGSAITRFSWLSLKHSVKLESKGLRFRGGSRTALAKRRLGLKRTAKLEEIIQAIDAKIKEIDNEG